MQQGERNVCMSISLVVIFVSLLSPVCSQVLWENSNFDYLYASQWVWLPWGFLTPLPSEIFSIPSNMLIYNDPTGFNGPISTNVSFAAGAKVIYVEWVANNHSNTVIELLSEELMAAGQFATDNCWPNCGEIDVYEMLRIESATSLVYGAPSNYGAMTLHAGSREDPCFCPSLGGDEKWYENTQPLTSSCSADFQNFPNRPNSMAIIFDEDENGQFLQFMQFPEFIPSGDYMMVVNGTGTIATPKIYNNAQSFFGFDPATCGQGDPNDQTGWPFFAQPMKLILWEQDYSSISTDTLTGSFQVTDIQVYYKPGQVPTTSSSPSSSTGKSSSSTGKSSSVSGESSTTKGSGVTTHSNISAATRLPLSLSYILLSVLIAGLILVM